MRTVLVRIVFLAGDRGRRMVEAEQLRHDFADVVLAFVGDEHARRDAVGLAARHERFETSLHAEVERHFAVGANVGDVTVAERHKMACGKLGSLLVVDAHGGVEAALFRQTRVDADDRHADGLELLDLVGVDIEGDDDYRVDVAAHRQHVEEFTTFLDARHLVDGNVVSLVVEDLVEAFDDG